MQKTPSKKFFESVDYVILESEMGNVASTISEKKSDHYNYLAQKLIDTSANSKTFGLS